MIPELQKRLPIYLAFLAGGFLGFAFERWTWFAIIVGGIAYVAFFLWAGRAQEHAITAAYNAGRLRRR